MARLMRFSFDAKVTEALMVSTIGARDSKLISIFLWQLSGFK